MPAPAWPYGPAVAALVDRAALSSLGAGTPNVPARGALAALDPQSLASPHPLRDREMALACIAGLWLRHDFLDESHQVSQTIDTPAGSFWHAIMHRREGDFSNSKYWFRRVGQYAVFGPLAEAAGELAARHRTASAAAFLTTQAVWDPFKFVDLCQHAGSDESLTGLCRTIQHREWQLLFDDCFARAIGK
jgi:hypothetical protein